MFTDSSRTNVPDGAYRAALLAIVGYFAVRVAYFAVAVDPGVPPDEATHLGRILAYSKVWGWPTGSPANYELGLLTHRPFLYSWLLGKLVLLNAFGMTDLLFLRLVNSLFGVGTVIYALRFIRVVSADRLTHVLFLFLVTNTLMFTGISGAVSYDNATNLLAAGAIFHAFRLGRSTRSSDLVAFVAFAAAGCLTKRSFLPLAALLALGVLVRERHQIASLVRGLDVRSPAFALAALLTLATAALYGDNLVRYQRLVPGFEQVVGVESARANRIFARDDVLDGFREGRLAYREALARADQIRHAGDRRATRMQLEQIRKKGDWRVPPATYVRLWSRIMLDRATGYFGHQVIRRTSAERAAYTGVLCVALALNVIGWRRADSRPFHWAGALALGYGSILLALVNYPTYLQKGLLDAGVQGRYLFPVLVPLLGWVAHALAAIPPRAARWPLALAAAALFFYGDLPTFLLRATPAWFWAPA